MTTDVVSLRHVFAPDTIRRLTVPSFQRDYSWSPSRAVGFIRSLLRGGGKPVLCGPLVLHAREEDPSSMNVMDGRQRITTLFLFAVVLRDLVWESTTTTPLDSGSPSLASCAAAAASSSSSESTKAALQSRLGQMHRALDDLESLVLLRGGANTHVRFEMQPFLDGSMSDGMQREAGLLEMLARQESQRPRSFKWTSVLQQQQDHQSPYAAVLQALEQELRHGMRTNARVDDSVDRSVLTGEANATAARVLRETSYLSSMSSSAAPMVMGAKEILCDRVLAVLTEFPNSAPVEDVAVHLGIGNSLGNCLGVGVGVGIGHSMEADSSSAAASSSAPLLEADMVEALLDAELRKKVHSERQAAHEAASMWRDMDHMAQVVTEACKSSPAFGSFVPLADAPASSAFRAHHPMWTSILSADVRRYISAAVRSCPGSWTELDDEFSRKGLFLQVLTLFRSVVAPITRTTATSSSSGSSSGEEDGETDASVPLSVFFARRWRSCEADTVVSDIALLRQVLLFVDNFILPRDLRRMTSQLSSLWQGTEEYSTCVLSLEEEGDRLRRWRSSIHGSLAVLRAFDMDGWEELALLAMMTGTDSSEPGWGGVAHRLHLIEATVARIATARLIGKADETLVRQAMNSLRALIQSSQGPEMALPPPESQTGVYGNDLSEALRGAVVFPGEFEAPSGTEDMTRFIRGALLSLEAFIRLESDHDPLQQSRSALAWHIRCLAPLPNSAAGGNPLLQSLGNVVLLDEGARSQIDGSLSMGDRVQALRNCSLSSTVVAAQGVAANKQRGSSKKDVQWPPEAVADRLRVITTTLTQRWQLPPLPEESTMHAGAEADFGQHQQQQQPQHYSVHNSLVDGSAGMQGTAFAPSLSAGFGMAATSSLGGAPMLGGGASALAGGGAEMMHPQHMESQMKQMYLIVKVDNIHAPEEWRVLQYTGKQAGVKPGVSAIFAKARFDLIYDSTEHYKKLREEVKRLFSEWFQEEFARLRSIPGEIMRLTDPEEFVEVPESVRETWNMQTKGQIVCRGVRNKRRRSSMMSMSMPTMPHHAPPTSHVLPRRVPSQLDMDNDDSQNGAGGGAGEDDDDDGDYVPSAKQARLARGGDWNA